MSKMIRAGEADESRVHEVPATLNSRQKRNAHETRHRISTAWVVEPDELRILVVGKFFPVLRRRDACRIVLLTKWRQFCWSMTTTASASCTS